ncbi:hypothetical protein [Longirhabdus pacifica]|uniref:hypothetical protein n=1 Tax=Longirhabdus pacifica TaxID=2305227 RepID=UPI0010093625|nr:hypothetical protein [Longirhabdus pacifica]
MKKKITNLALCTALLTSGVVIGSQLPTEADGVVTDKPASIEDPVVTKSYVDQKNADEIKNQIGNFDGNGGGISTTSTIVKLTKGQTLYADEGTEFVVRNGEVFAVSDDGVGIPDLTGGEDIQPGAAISVNHLLRFPREGRGIKADASTAATIYVMVNGGYQHLDASGNDITE